MITRRKATERRRKGETDMRSTSKRKPKPQRDDTTLVLDTAAPLALAASDLLPGDILLYRPKHPDFKQRKIAKATKSPYTHAAIYLGDGSVAESVRPRVRVVTLSEAVAGCLCVGILRTQIDFADWRVKRLRAFIAALVANKAKYDLLGALSAVKRRENHMADELETIRRNFGKARSAADFVNSRYFCSALVVACYCIANLIGASAHVAYPTDIFAPGDLHRDVTFGWFLGYLVPRGHTVPTTDPLRLLTSWTDLQSARWW